MVYISYIRYIVSYIYIYIIHIHTCGISNVVDQNKKHRVEYQNLATRSELMESSCHG